MTVKELAERITGREIGEEITRNEVTAAKEAGLVVVFGYSDDNMEIRGAIDSEMGCYNGGITVYITKDGILEEPPCNGECRYFASVKKDAHTIKAVWHDEGEPCWSYETDIPHETFEVFEDGDLFCEGIVFCLDDLA